MEANQKSQAKKQWLKNQKYKRKAHETQGESPSPSPATGVSASDPQPQRANRRQRNEAQSSSNSVENPIPSASEEIKDTTEKVNVTIDFSNLKRETDEIAKLTKKFAKRNVSSNWHRYSAPEGHEDDGETAEEAPADFSALIQRASKGGHLQLKEEQDWSSASGEQLGGYFALNLKLLGQSLACVPLYKQLRLPIHILTEGDLKHFDELASQASKAYNPDNQEDPNENTLLKLRNLLLRETEYIMESNTKNQVSNSDGFNILDIHESTKKLLQMELEPEIVSENGPIIKPNSQQKEPFSEKSTSDFNIGNNGNFIQLNKEFSGGHRVLEEVNQNNLPLLNNLTENMVTKTEKIDLPEKIISLSKGKSETPEKDMLSGCQAELQLSVEGTGENIEEKCFTEAEKDKSMNTTKEISQTANTSRNEITLSEPRDKRLKPNRKTPVKDIDNNKASSRENTIKLEDDDDDDLDFLLSLKKPVTPTKKELKPVTNKDSSYLPGSGRTAQVSASEQPSELDDWLDSVLQD